MSSLRLLQLLAGKARHQQHPGAASRPPQLRGSAASGLLTRTPDRSAMATCISPGPRRAPSTQQRAARVKPGPLTHSRGADAWRAAAAVNDNADDSGPGPVRRSPAAMHDGWCRSRSRPRTGPAPVEWGHDDGRGPHAAAEPAREPPGSSEGD